jgi:hypothetical protein
MAVRSTMAALISRVRLLINDTGSTQYFTDQQIQDVLDATRMDMRYLVLTPAPTYVGNTLQYLDYYADFTDWEDDVAFRQWLTNPVTPSSSENITGHWVFSATTLPPVYLVGKTYDVYRCAADLLERLSAQWVLRYNVNVDGQTLQRSQVAIALQNLAHTYRLKQRPHVISISRSDIAGSSQDSGVGLGPVSLDYFSSGDGR